MLGELFGFKKTSTSTELPEIFPLEIKKSNFIEIDVKNIYSKILNDVFERTHGLTDEQLPLLFDNCLASEHSFGLISMLAQAMANKTRLFLVYQKDIDLVRKATQTEQAQIERDYKEKNSSDTGIFVSFENYDRSDMVKLYSALEYCAVAAFNKNMNLAKALQVKMNDMRASVNLVDSDKVVEQAQAIAKSLAAGRDVLIDAKDILDLLKPDSSAAEGAMNLINQRRAFYLGSFPASYVSGLLGKGLGDTGNADARATERGLKGYFFSIVKPVVEALFEVKVTFRTEDYESMATALETLRTFEITADDYLTADEKKSTVRKMFGFGVEKAKEP